MFLTFTFFSIVNCSNKNKTMRGYDVELFKNTIAWDLAQAIDKEDTIKLKELLKKTPKKEIDFQESTYGQTLLNFAVYSYKYNSVRILTEYGADPNLPDTYSGTTPFIEACNITDDDRYFKLLLEHGGNPNYVNKIKKPTHLRTPLIAASKNLGYIKVLISNGADPNFHYVYKNQRQSLLEYAFYSDNIDIVKYLIVDLKVDCKKPLMKNIENEDLYVTHFLRDLNYTLDSKEYQKKMEIVNYLKKEGIDYFKSPIPELTIELAKRKYPNSWQEYLDNY
jgi:hypothetical protein